MKLIQEAAVSDQLVRENHIRERFDTQDLTFRAQRYQKGELLCSPLNSTESLLFLVQGSVQMYDLHDDGTKVPVTSVSDNVVIGDIEFITCQPTSYFVEAAEECLCLALPFEENREALSRDVRFLHSLLDSVAGKFIHSADQSIGASGIEEKLLQYLRQDTEDHEIHEVEPVLYQLHCGRRQLQRVLKKLCDNGELVRLGRGHYQLKAG